MACKVGDFDTNSQVRQEQGGGQGSGLTQSNNHGL